MKTKLRLTLDVEYAEVEDVTFLENALYDLVLRAVGEGLLTGCSEAEVDSYTYKVEEMK